MRKSLPSMPSRTRLIAIAFTFLFVSAVVIQQLYFARPVAAAISVFINEIHYDNTGTDAGEAIEVAGPAGTSLTGWSIVLYNGAGGASYTTTPLAGIIPNQQAGFGTLHFTYPENGIQNGSPDGIALVNGTTVVQFLSYEGAFTAVGGPANGMLSVNIGVAENGTEAVGQSLRLSGTGQFYEDFTWNAPATASFGAINTGQSFGVGDAAPTVLTTIPITGATNVAVDTNITINFSESVNATSDAFVLECPAATPIAFTQSASPNTSFTLNPNVNLPFSTTCVVTVVGNQISDLDVNDPPDNMAGLFVFNFTTGAPPPPVAENVIINELDSDTDGADEAEFVELYDGGVGNTSLTGLVLVFYNGGTANVSYRAIDLDGFSTNAQGYFTVGNAAVPGVDTTFPNGILQNGEDAVALYAGNAADFPNGSTVTTANLRDAVVYGTADPNDPELLALLNAGQPQVNESGGTAPAVDSIGRCPNGEGGARNTTTYVARTPTPDGANNCPPPPVVAAIHDVQGNGAISPFAGLTVITSGIVTARKSNGFFMQDPIPDADPNTSEGIFVFVGAVPGPTAAVGDAVTVTGTATEFFNLTQISSSNATVSISSSGNPLPAPIVLTTTILNPAGPPDQLERFEGMRMHADTLVSVAGTNEFGEISTVLEGVARPMREPGIEISQPVPPDPTSGLIDCCIPRWDENPERITVDTDGLVGSTRLNVTSNVTLSNITGPLDFSFSFYKVLPETTPTNSPNMSAVPVPTPAAGEFTVAGYNIENFIAANTTQKQKAALAIRDVLHLPDIIGTIEIGNLAALQALTVEIETISGVQYEARLLGTNGTQQVGFLVKTPRIQIDSVVQEELAGCIFNTPATCNNFIDPTTNQLASLNDRPPLVLRATVDPLSANPQPIIVVVNHTRSFIDIELVSSEGSRVRAKRKAQAEFLAELLQDLQTANPNTPVISIGDYNAYQFNDGYTDPIATIKGTPTADDQMVVDASPDVVTPDFINLTDTLPADQRYSFIFEGTPQALDHFIINTTANAILQRYHIARNNSDFPEGPLFANDATRPERNSDHDMPVGYFKFAKAVTSTTVSDVATGISAADQSVTLTANVSGPAPISEGTVTFTVRDSGNNVIGLPVVGNVSGGVATANYILPGGTTAQTLTITGEFSGGDFTQPSSDTGTLSVSFNICLLYDPDKAVKSGATYPIKIQLCDSNGNNLSSASIVVHAVNIEQVATSIDGDVITAGNANADSDFRFENGSYIFNLKTTGLSTGTYKLYFTAGDDPTLHSVEFQVK